MVRTQIQLTDEQANKLKKLAASRHLSVAELIRQAVDVMVKSGGAVDVEERRVRAFNIAGKFGSGRHNVSKEHDRYLAEAFSK
jgi:predicted transcriptional regulator